MKKLLGIVALMGCVGAGAESLSFIGTTDKNPLEYKLNETITFTVTLIDKDANNAAVTGRDLRWTLSHDDSSLNRSGTATSDTPLVVTTAMSAPGFARLKVEVKSGDTWLSDNSQFFDGGAGADVMNIQEWPEPDDFRSFWTTATNTLYTTAYTPVCTNFTPAAATAGVEYYLFEIPTLPGLLPVTGILAKPAEADPASCGLVATFNGYGFGATGLPNSSTVLQGNIVINVARHGEYPVNPDASYYTGLQNGSMKSFCFRNLNGTVQETDQYGMILRDLRALQFAKSLPEWNGETVKVSGGSMGGYQSLAVAALDKDVTTCTVSIPWHVDLSSGVKFGRMTGWRPDWTANMDYVDAKNFAKLIRCPVTFTAGIGDYVCPPSGEVILFKNLPEPKKVTWTQNSGHAGNHGPNCAQYVWQLPEPEPEPEPEITRTLNWVGGGANKLFSNALNWKDASGNTNAVPRSGDILVISANTGSAKNDIPNLYLKQFKVSGYQEADASGEPIILTSDSGGIYNTGYLHLDFPVALVGTNVPYYSSSTCVQRGRLSGLNGADAGIVKLGSQRAGISGAKISDVSAYAGFRYVTIREGQWIYGINAGTSKMNLLPAGQTVTFDGVGTSLGISQDCVFSDFCLRETANARNKTHAITCQVDDNGTKVYRAKLTVTGTPPDDETIFTGTFETSVDFCWNPTSSLKTFTLSGKTSTTTGNVEIANGTLRLTAGAGYSKLGELKLSGGTGAKFVVDTVPNNAFRARSLVLSTGEERLQLSSGVSIAVGGATVNGARIAPGTYTTSNASWISGAGSVVVEGVANHTLRWAKRATYSNLNWSNPQNWVSDETGKNEAPVDGDTIYLPGRSDYNAGGTAGRTDNNRNDFSQFRPRRVYVQGGYSSPQGNPVIFDGTDPTDGIYNAGYMYYHVPTIVNTDKITLSALSGGNIGHRGNVYSTDGHAFTVLKKGPGLFGLQCQSEGENSYAGFRRLELHEGKFSFSWQGFGVGTSFPKDLEIVYAAKSTYLQFSVNTTLRGAVLSEAAAVTNQTHYLGSQAGEVVTLSLVGEPAADSFFTGVMQDPLSLLWGPANGRTFTFSGASSKNVTTGTLTITNGTVCLKDGATFTALGTLALNGDANACFRVEAVPSQPFHADTLTLATGAERIYVEGGVKIAVGTATVNGTALPAGVYCAQENVGGTSVDWVTGGGYVCVGGADITLPTEATETTTATWTAGGGADTALGTAANWEGQAVPDLAAGSLQATFAAGSGAALDQNAAFKGLALNALGAFSLTAPDATKYVALGSLGLTTAGSSKTYTFSWPLYLMTAQTWTIGAGDTMNLNGKMAGASSLTIANAGTLNVTAASALSGPVSVSGGTLNLNADGAFGASSVNPLEVDFSTTKFNMNGITLKRPLKSAGGSGVTFPANTANVIEGDCDFTRNDNVTLAFGANASLRVKGSWKRGTTAWDYFMGTSSAEPAIVHFDGPMAFTGPGANGISGNISLYLNAPQNDLATVWFWMMGSNNRLYTMTENAFRFKSGDRPIIRATDVTASTWDLCGHDQKLYAIGAGSGMTITSAEPAMLHLATNGHPWDWSKTNAGHFTGAASLSFEGSDATSLTGASTSTGVVQVTKGTLTITSTGSWPNASAAIVKGGTLKLEHKAVFGEGTVLKVTTGGTANLSYTGAMKLASFELDGEEMPKGVYGGPASTAANKLACFAGTGTVSIGEIGTMVIFR